MKSFKYVYILLLGMLVAACQTESWEASRGGLCITLGEDVSVITKSTPSELGKPVANNFTVKIVKESTGEIIYNDLYTSNTIPASVGSYSITASYGTDPVIALDSPYYKGEMSGVEVADESSTPVNLTCKVANALTSVVYGEGQVDKFNALFSTYSVEVKVGNSSVNIGKNGSVKQSAYYRAGSIPTFTFKGTLKENSQNVSMEITSDELTADAFQAGKHCLLTLTLKPATAGAIITVEKVEVKNVTITETIPVEWLPAPKISYTGFDDNKTLTVYETGDVSSASIDFNVSQPLQDLSFTLNFVDEQFNDLNKTYQLSTMTDDEKIKISDAGITLPLIGSTEPKITFPDTFVAQLQSQNNGVVNNTITINSVTANNRTNTDGPQTYTIAVQKPEFSVSVLPGNIWSKEFTVEEIAVEEGKGNLEKIKENLVYQYQDADGNWNNCSNQDTRQQIFAEHPQNRNYKVRALYRGSLASNEVDVEMEEPKALPNGNMDAWTETTRTTSWWVFGTKYADQPFFEPWNVTVEQWWDTNNIITMPTSITATGINFKCFPTTTFKTPGYGQMGKAAVIRTINVNNANTSGTHFGDNIRGILYAGTTSSDGNLSEGRPWNSRPTQLSFKYQYSSYDNERFGVYVELYADGNSSPIATGTFESVNGESKTDFTPQTINLEYSNLELKPSTIKIKFCSVAINDEPAIQQNIEVNVPEGSSNYYNVHGGSVLTIDDISFIYDK